MIPQKQLENLKPLPDQLIREKMVKSKRTIPYKKGRLTKRARQYASWIQSLRYKSTSEPKGTKWKGQKKMSERK